MENKYIHKQVCIYIYTAYLWISSVSTYAISIWKAIVNHALKAYWFPAVLSVGCGEVSGVRAPLMPRPSVSDSFKVMHAT